MPTPPPLSFANETRGAAMVPSPPNPIDLVEVPDSSRVVDLQGNVMLKAWDLDAGAWRTGHPVDIRAMVNAATAQWTEPE